MKTLVQQYLVGHVINSTVASTESSYYLVNYLSTCTVKSSVSLYDDNDDGYGDKGKVSFYIAQYPFRWITQSTLHFTSAKHVHSDTNSNSLGSILAMQQLRAMTKSLTFPPLSIARYSFI